MHKEVVCTVKINITNMENVFFYSLGYSIVQFDVYVFEYDFFKLFLFIYFIIFIYKWITL